jgi:hypothetical protein
VRSGVQFHVLRSAMLIVVFHGACKFLHACARRIPQIMARPISSTFFPTHYSVTIILRLIVSNTGNVIKYTLNK